MDFSLSNSLVGNAVLGGDGLSLDLQFSTDKTLTARKGPTPAFTRASIGTFVGSNGFIQTSSGSARFDHDPVTLSSKGLLIEESRTNTLTQSGDLMNAAWTVSTGATRAVSSSVLSPDGVNYAVRITEDVSMGLHRCSHANVPRTSGNVYTFSIYAKQDSSRAVAIDGGVLFNASAKFDLNNGTIIATTAGTSKIENAGNGWYRCIMTGTATTTGNSTVFLDSYNKTLSTITYLGDGVSGYHLWGGQFEQGAFATSYIPTTTSVVRSADVCSITGTNFTGFWNQSAGTLLEVFEVSPNTNTSYVTASNGDIAQNSVHLDNDTGNIRAVYYSGSSIVAALGLGAVGTVGTVNKVATAYAVNDFSASRNGATVVTDTLGALPVSLTQMNIGADERAQTPQSFYTNKCIKSLSYYRKRLTNAKLQTLTV